MSKIDQQVSHWVHDEQACVTVQRVVQTFDLSWPAAFSLLKGIPKEGHQYSVTKFASIPASGSNDGASKAFRLVKSSYDTTGDPDEASIWYALALEGCTESIHTAHEKDAAQFRDGVETFSVSSSLRPWEKSGNEEASKIFSSSIDVSESMAARLAALGKRKANDDAFSATPSLPPKAASTRFAHTKKTKTTAISFFSKNSGGATGKASVSTKSEASGTTTASKGSKGRTTARPKHTSTLSFQPRKREGMQVGNRSANKRAVDEEKENVQNKNAKMGNPKVGNADDVVFDEESSDEDEEIEPPPPSKPVVARKEAGNATTAKKGSGQKVQGDEEAPRQNKDDAKSKTDASDVPKPRPKRKVMKEVTAMDESGYLYTETKAVWEDVPSDEDEKPFDKSKMTNKPKKSSATAPKALKQQSLMGFFSKKK